MERPWDLWAEYTFKYTNDDDGIHLRHLACDADVGDPEFDLSLGKSVVMADEHSLTCRFPEVPCAGCGRLVKCSKPFAEYKIVSGVAVCPDEHSCGECHIRWMEQVMKENQGSD